ncbi:hypothetical protein M8J77_006236 [Diaphorina citri]|nr:hypothetical protein M8J77_006236 [Diaphorina citri]
MAMSQQKGKYKNNVKLAQKHLEEMLNNKKYSDTVFLVNGNQFYALSYLMAISSKAFDSLLNDHFENCGDKKIRINNVKFEDSFLIILKYIYGVEIDLDEIPPGVLCEVVCLAETYELTEFCSDLKVHLSGLKEFQVDAVVVLLNTASKLDVTQLYNRLTDFVFLNTEQLVKHRSFVDLQFHVLVDLIKSDLFFAPEIDILTAVLKWHFDMSKGRTKRQGTPEKEIVGKGVIEEENGDSDTQTEVSSFDNLDSADTFDSKSDGDDTNENLPKGTEDFIPEEQTEQSMKSCEDNIQGDQACSQMELILSFSENVLKELLSHIRIQRIYALEYIKAMETELFKNYKDILMDDKHFTQNSEPRYQNHTPSSIESTCDVNPQSVPVSIESNGLTPSTCDVNPQSVPVSIESNGLTPSTCDVNPQSVPVSIESNGLTPSTCDVNPQSLPLSLNDSCCQSVNRSTKSGDVYIVFTLPTPILFSTPVSKEEVIFDHFRWKLKSKYSKSKKLASFYIHCTHNNEVEWECTVECQLHMISNHPDVPDKIFPSDKPYKSLQFSAKYPKGRVGDLHNIPWRGCNFLFGNVYKFEVHFKSIESKFARK